MGTVAQGPRKVGLIDVGGGLRGAYGAGVLDRCIDDGIRFDYCIGVSAGSANVAAFLAGQKGRNLRFYAAVDGSKSLRATLEGYDEERDEIVVSVNGEETVVSGVSHYEFRSSEPSNSIVLTASGGDVILARCAQIVGMHISIR